MVLRFARSRFDSEGIAAVSRFGGTRAVVSLICGRRQRGALHLFFQIR
jgi:hypothetical protein